MGRLELCNAANALGAVSQLQTPEFLLNGPSLRGSLKIPLCPYNSGTSFIADLEIADIGDIGENM